MRGDMSEKIEFKFNLTEAYENKSKDIPLGIIKGYLATWDIDRGRDRFEQGAFSKSIMRHRKNNRPIRMKGFHENIIGGFPIENVYEDDKGLWVEGEINLEVKEGLEIFALIRQGILTDMSIGYSIKDSEIVNGIRVIREAEIWEGSVVDEPMNPQAVISEVKSVNDRSKLPKQFADRTFRWDSMAAEKRITGNEDGAFLYENGEGEYKLQIADIVDGSIKIIPRAVFAARAILSGAKGGIKAPEKEMQKLKDVINTLYNEMALEEPFADGKAKAFTIIELKNMQRSILFDVIRHQELSKNAAEQIVNAIDNGERLSDADEKQISDALEELKSTIKGAK